MNGNPQRKYIGVTMSELLAVVAGLGLLAVVLTSNLHDARLAAQVTQAKADLAAVKLGLEAYRVDQGAYIFMNAGNHFLLPEGRDELGQWRRTMERLTTPVSYLNGAAPFWDPFDPVGASRIGSPNSIMYPSNDNMIPSYKRYFYLARNDRELVHWGDLFASPTWYLLHSAGPDRLFTYLGNEMNSVLSDDTPATRAVFYSVIYDPTNGATSFGSIWDAGGTPEGRGAAMGLILQGLDNTAVSDWHQY